MIFFQNRNITNVNSNMFQTSSLPQDFIFVKLLSKKRYWDVNIYKKGDEEYIVKRYFWDDLFSKEMINEITVYLEKIPFVATCENIYFDLQTNQCFIVLKNDGVELSDFIFKNENRKYCEEIISKINVALQHFHSSGWVHCDLKMENILVKIQDGNIEIKFIDFGLSIKEKCLVVDQSIFQTPYITAPEIETYTNFKISKKIDYWSFGVIIFFMTNGIQIEDFYSSRDKDFDVYFDLIYSQGIKNTKEPMKTYCKYLLQKNPEERQLFDIQCIEKNIKSDFDYEDFFVKKGGRKDVILTIAEWIKEVLEDNQCMNKSLHQYILQDFVKYYNCKLVKLNKVQCLAICTVYLYLDHVDEDYMIYICDNSYNIEDIRNMFLYVFSQM